MERKNGGPPAEALGERGPPGVQRLLYEADWDHEAVRDDLRAYVLDHLGEEVGILVVDETGFREVWEEFGRSCTAVQRNGWRSRELPDRGLPPVRQLQGSGFHRSALYLPEEWTEDRVRCREAGIPDAVSFATYGELARAMLERAFTAGVKPAWMVGDTIYGADELRTWLERQQQAYVLALAETHPVWNAGRAQSAGLIAALLPAEAWTPLSAGEGSQGPRLYH